MCYSFAIAQKNRDKSQEAFTLLTLLSELLHVEKKDNTVIYRLLASLGTVLFRQRGMVEFAVEACGLDKLLAHVKEKTEASPDCQTALAELLAVLKDPDA